MVLTGTLLALDAPVVGSGASKPGAEGFDDVGFFSHWSATAKERGVKALYANSKLDIEAVTAEKPDLIIIASTGGDSTKDDYDSLSRIAPTVAINYNSESWQTVTDHRDGPDRFDLHPQGRRPPGHHLGAGLHHDRHTHALPILRSL